MKIISKYKFAKSSEKKLRLILKFINKKKSINDILNTLTYINKKSSFLIKKTIQSAVFNAKNNYKLLIDNLKINKILIDKGPSTKRIFPRAKGRVNYIKKRTCHITVELINIKN